MSKKITRTVTVYIYKAMVVNRDSLELSNIYVSLVNTPSIDIVEKMLSAEGYWIKEIVLEKVQSKKVSMRLEDFVEYGDSKILKNYTPQEYEEAKEMKKEVNEDEN